MLEPAAAAKTRDDDTVHSAGFNALAWSDDELAVIALNIFLEVRRRDRPRETAG